MALGDPYITSTELARHLRMDASAEMSAATDLTLACSSVSRWVTHWCGRDFNLAATATPRQFDVRRDGSVPVDDIGDAAITVKTDSANDGTFATTWTSADFQVSPLGALAVGEPVTDLLAVGSLTFPPVTRRRGLVQVTARWGWPAIPSDVKHATLIQASRIFKRRESPEGVLGGGDFGLVRVGSRLDPDVEGFLAPYRLISIA